jgi:heat shock protein HslJ
MMKTIIAGFLYLLLACQGPSSSHPAPSADTAIARKPSANLPRHPDTTTLAGTWFLQPVLASDTATGKRPFLRFDLSKAHFYGHTGCNHMNGQFWYSDQDSSLTFNDKIITTRMACPGYNEQGFLKNLLHTSHYRLKNGVLVLLSDDKAELSRWERKNSTPEKHGKT